MSSSTVIRDPEILGGTPVFRGTRVPVRTLIEHIEAGETLEAFLEGFRTVSGARAIAFLEEAQKRVIDAA